MATYTAPKLVRPGGIIGLILMVGLVCFWLVNKDSEFLLTAVIIAFLAFCLILGGWLWARGFVRRIDIVDDTCHVICWNRKEVRFSVQDIEKIQVKRNLGFQEAIIRMRNGQLIRMTSHMTGFIQILQSLAYTEAPPDQSHAFSRFYFLIATLLILPLAAGALNLWIKEEATLTVYSAAVLFVIMAIFAIWVFSLAKKPPSENEKRE